MKHLYLPTQLSRRRIMLVNVLVTLLAKVRVLLGMRSWALYIMKKSGLKLNGPLGRLYQDILNSFRSSSSSTVHQQVENPQSSMSLPDYLKVTPLSSMPENLVVLTTLSPQQLLNPTLWSPSNTTVI